METAKVAHRKGAKILARWEQDGKYYPATYHGLNDDGSHKIKWHEPGWGHDTVQKVKAVKPKAKAKRAPPPVDPAPVVPAPTPNTPHPALPERKPEPPTFRALGLPKVSAPIIQGLSKDKEHNPYGDDYRVRDAADSSLIGHINDKGNGTFEAHHKSGKSTTLHNTTLEGAAKTLHDYHRSLG